jgi:hypothetical protein
MEHRCGTRTAVNRTVRARVGDGPSVVACLRDVSASGAFLVMQTSVAYLAEVHLSLRVRRNRRIVARKFSGIAIRNAVDGVGVEWRAFSPQLARRLAQKRPARTKLTIRLNEDAACSEERAAVVPSCMMAKR